MEKNKHSFSHLDKKYTLYKRERSGENPWCYSPRWGENGKQILLTFRDKITGRPLTAAEAEDELKEAVKTRSNGLTHFEVYREGTKLRGGLTVGKILDEWVAAGYPDDVRRKRGEEQQQRQAELLPLLRRWWDSQLVVSIDGPMLGEYAAWRSQNCRKGFDGSRVTDRDLLCLGNAFSWAVAAGRVKSNPFKERPRFNKPDDVVHCHTFMPESDEELHRLCGHLILNQNNYCVVAGGLLMFLALSGLRPGEGEALRWDAGYEKGNPAPGHIFPVTLDGVTVNKLRVLRSKGGINPAIVVRPVLGEFLKSWQKFSQARWQSPWFFPNPSDPKEAFPTGQNRLLNKLLTRAADDLGLGERHPHAMRAFYVRVRRSQGVDDDAIARELGQGSGARIIVDTYGEPDGIFGDGRFDWLPAEGVPCWERLQAISNVISL